MSEFVLRIDTDNAAFEFPEIELARILRHAADLVEGGYHNAPLLDINGNRVGEFQFIVEDSDG